MPTIAEIRQKFPMYSDISDGDLVRGLHKKFYSDIPYQDFLKKVDFRESVDPTVGMSGAQKFLAGVGKANMDIGRGLGQMLGIGPTSAEVAETRELEKPLMQTGAGVAGNIIGNVALALPTMAVPGANTYTGAAAVGAGLAALQPLTDDESRLMEAGKGAAFGMGGQATARGLGRMLAPQTRPEAVALSGAGVTLTPGQTLGGAFQRIEEGATSVPILGDAIKAAQRRGIESFDEVAINRALNPIGQQLPKGIKGNEAIGYAQDALGDAYERLLPNLRGDLNAVRGSAPSLAQELQGIRQMAQNMPDAQMNQLNRILDNEVINRFTNQGLASGETLKNIESKLGGLARNFGKSDNYDVRILGDAIEETQAALRRMITGVNPGYATELSRINQGYANFKRVQRAAAATGAQEGVFSPAQLHTAVKALDRSKDKAKFARGNALMQDLSTTGKDVLGSKVPDSGTPFRLGNALMLGSGFINPLIPLAAGAGAAMYSRPAQNALRVLLTERPQALRQLAPGIERLGLIGPATYAGME